MAVEVDEPKKKSAIEVAEPKKRLAVEESAAVQSIQHLQPKRHRTKRGRRVAIAIAAVGVLTIAYLAWKYVWPLLR